MNGLRHMHVALDRLAPAWMVRGLRVGARSALAGALIAAAAGASDPDAVAPDEMTMGANPSVGRATVAAFDPPPPPISRAEREARFAEARALGDRREWDAALVTVRELRRSLPRDFDLALFEARCLGWADDDEGSVNAYKVIDATWPERLEEYGHDYGRRLMWTDRTGPAIMVFDRLLALEPDNLDYQRNRALALSWAGQPGDAADAYREVVARDPDDVDSRMLYLRNLIWANREAEARAHLRTLGPEGRAIQESAFLARLEMWRNRNIRALGVMSELVLESPEDADTRAMAELVEEIARAQWWTGDAAGAVGTLDRYLAAAPDSMASLGRLREEIVTAEKRPYGETRITYSEDNGQFIIRSQEFTGGFSPRLNGVLGASVRIDRYTQFQQNLSITRIGVLGRWRLGDIVSRWNVRVGEAREIDFNPVTGSVSLEWRATDIIELAASYEMTDYESFLAFERQIQGRFLNGTAIYEPTTRWRASLGAGKGWIRGNELAMDNTRVHGVAGLRYKASRRPRLNFVGGFYGFRYTELTADGYWNPESFTSWSLGFDLNPSYPRLRSEIAIAANYSWQRELPSEFTSVSGSFVGRYLFHPAPLWTLEYGYTYSDSKLASTEGFARHQHWFRLAASF